MAKQSNVKKYAVIYLSLTAFLLALCITITAGMYAFARNMDFLFGAGDMIVTPAVGTEDWDKEYYKSSYGGDKDKIEDAARTLTERLEEEGIVLLKNQNGALPLDRSQPGQRRVSAFGWAFSHPVYGGTGSGDIGDGYCVTPQAGLENAGFSVNPTLVGAYDEWSRSTERLTNWGTRVNCNSRPEVSVSYSDWDIIEKPLSSDEVAQAEEYSDVALIFIARQGGEGTDLPVTMGGYTFYGPNRTNQANSFGYDEGKHYLELSEGERQMIERVSSAGFEKVIVVINSANPIEAGELQASPDIDGIVLVGAPGSSGFNALGKILSGEVVPSGRTADIFAADFTADPTFPNFSDPTYYSEDGGVRRRNQYTNVSGETTAFDCGYFVQYEEGIYMGYRYYETAALLGTIDYSSAVVYPFGYGLSYTTFEQSITESSVRGGMIEVTIRVCNTGRRAGKDVIQLYYSAPFGADETGGAPVIEKAYKVLAAFTKTDVIPAGAEAEYTLSFPVSRWRLTTTARKGATFSTRGYTILSSVKTRTRSGTALLTVRVRASSMAKITRASPKERLRKSWFSMKVI